MLKRNFWSTLSILAAATLLSLAASLLSAEGASINGLEDDGFSVKEYKDFHEVLHPLEHEALPKNDFKTIRAKAPQLLKLGEAILNLGVPRGVEAKHTSDFKEWLQKFGEALREFKRDARDGTDDRLKASYSAVHDSFEMLAAMLPGK